MQNYMFLCQVRVQYLITEPRSLYGESLTERNTTLKNHLIQEHYSVHTERPNQVHPESSVKAVIQTQNFSYSPTMVYFYCPIIIYTCLPACLFIFHLNILKCIVAEAYKCIINLSPEYIRKVIHKKPCKLKASSYSNDRIRSCQYHVRYL